MKPKAHARSASGSLSGESSEGLLTEWASAQYRCGYSATVEMELRIGDKVFRVGQLGPDFIILHEPADHPPAAGQMMLSRNDSVEQRF